MVVMLTEKFSDRNLPSYIQLLYYYFVKVGDDPLVFLQFSIQLTCKMLYGVTFSTKAGKNSVVFHFPYLCRFKLFYLTCYVQLPVTKLFFTFHTYSRGLKFLPILRNAVDSGFTQAVLSVPPPAANGVLQQNITVHYRRLHSDVRVCNDCKPYVTEPRWSRQLRLRVNSVSGLQYLATLPLISLVVQFHNQYEVFMWFR